MTPPALEVNISSCLRMAAWSELDYPNVIPPHLARSGGPTSKQARMHPSVACGLCLRQTLQATAEVQRKLQQGFMVEDGTDHPGRISELAELRASAHQKQAPLAVLHILHLGEQVGHVALST